MPKKRRRRKRTPKRLPPEETILDEGPPVPRGGDGYLSDVRGGKTGPVGTSKVNLRKYLDAVYERVGGSKAAVAAAKNHGWEIDPVTLDRDITVHDTNMTNNLGEYHPTDDIHLGWLESGSALKGRKRGWRTQEDVVDTLRHELDHAINRGTMKDDQANLVDTRSMDERVDAIAKSANSLGGLGEVFPDFYRQFGSKDPFRRYMGTTSEVRARALRKIKHWGAEKLGVLPQDKKAARELIDAYIDAHKPSQGSRSGAESDMWRELPKTEGIEGDLLRTVAAELKERIA